MLTFALPKSLSSSLFKSILPTFYLSQNLYLIDTCTLSHNVKQISKNSVTSPLQTVNAAKPNSSIYLKSFMWLWKNNAKPYHKVCQVGCTCVNHFIISERWNRSNIYLQRKHVTTIFPNIETCEETTRKHKEHRVKTIVAESWDGTTPAFGFLDASTETSYYTISVKQQRSITWHRVSVSNYTLVTNDDVVFCPLSQNLLILNTSVINKCKVSNSLPMPKSSLASEACRKRERNL